MDQEVYEQFDELENQHWWFCGRREYLNKIIGRLSFSNKETLEFCEIGAGTGGNLPMLCQYATVDAIEMNDAARGKIENKKIAGVKSVQFGFLPNDIPLARKYDGVFSLDVIEHVDEDRHALANLSEYMTDDGWLVTTVPAYQWLWSAHDEANHHKRRYTKSAYTQLIEQAGYTIEYSSYFNTLLFPLAVLERLAARFGGKGPESAVVKLPHPVINKVFKAIFGLESFLAGKISLPFGLSIVVVAKKK